MTSRAIDQIFIDFSCDKLRQLCGRIQDCLGKLDEEQIWLRNSEGENSAGNLVLHLTGNVGQWILAGVGGRPHNRDRDSEFAARSGPPASELAARLNDVVSEALTVIGALDAERLSRAVQIQNYNVTALEAVYHVIEHFAQHTGQIMFATKLFTGGDLGYYKHLAGPAHRESTP